MKRIAIAFLAGSILAIACSIQATLRAGEIFGPSAIVVTPSGEVWLGVDEQLWRIFPNGSLRDARDVSSLGMPGPPASLVRHPNGEIVATVRRDATLYFLDPGSGTVAHTLRPRWPTDLVKHGGRAINLAFDAQGRVAIATGGGHTVALFDADGSFLARTTKDSYRFTNGLWWVGSELWTTDTNRSELKQLDGTTLALHLTVVLGKVAGGRFLGPARGHRHVGADRVPMAALIRYRGGMTHGHVAMIASYGSAKKLPHSGKILQPRDLDWLGNDLLVTDGESFSVLSWSADGRALADFGDEPVRAALHQRIAKRDELRSHHSDWLLAAGLMFGVALLLVSIVSIAQWSLRIAQRLKRRLSSPPALDLSQLGTPVIDRRTLIRKQLQVSWPFALFLLPWGLLPIARWLNSFALVIASTVLCTVFLLLFPLMARRTLRFAQDQNYEPVFNTVAMTKLSGCKMVARLLRDGEQVLETFLFVPFGITWLVLTNERLFVFKSGLLKHKLSSTHDLNDIVATSTNQENQLRHGRLARFFARSINNKPLGWLEIKLADGRVLSGVVSPALLAARVAERIKPFIAQRTGSKPNSSVPTQAARGSTARRVRRALASMLVPGLGQWLQSRSTAALLLFTLWLTAVLFVTIPLLWTLVEPYTGTRPVYFAIVLGFHLLVSTIAAADAWRADMKHRG